MLYINLVSYIFNFDIFTRDYIQEKCRNKNGTLEIISLYLQKVACCILVVKLKFQIGLIATII